MKYSDGKKLAFQAAMGREIRKHRERVGLTMAKLGEKIGVSHSSIDKWEDGTSPVPAWAAYQLALVFDVTVDELMPDPKIGEEDAA